MTSIMNRFEEIQSKILAATRSSGRKPGTVALMAVTKTRILPEIIEAWQAGIRLFGENRVQEAALKIGEWPTERPAEWRLIGNLQRNKARKALDLFSRVDSVDRLELAVDLQRILSERDSKVEVLLEVNTSGEASKHGVSPERTEKLLEGILLHCPRVTIRGLMTVGPLGADAREAAAAFSLLRELRDGLSERLGFELPELSMGMSEDFEMAIEQGSTCVRLGRALFGPRE